MTTFAEIFGPQGFDCSSVDPADDFLKPGDYVVRIMESEIRANKAQNGHYLALVLQVMQEGDEKNRKLYDYINIQNPNQTAERLAAKSLSALGRSTGIWEITLPEQLLNQVVVAVVTKNDSGNNIRTYKPVAEMQTATATPPAPAAQTVPPPVLMSTSPMSPVTPVVPQTVPPPASAAPVYAPVIASRPPASEYQHRTQPVPAVAPAPAVAPLTRQAAAPPAVASVPVWQQPQQ